MADITEITTNQELLDELVDFINNPKFKPKNQDKYFFSTGMSYYQQLCSILKMLEGFSNAFKVVWENEKSLATNSVTTDKLDEAIADLKEELEDEIEALESGLETRFTSIETLLNSHSTQILQLQNLINTRLRGVQIEGVGITVADLGTTDGVQKFRLVSEGGGGGASLTQNLSYANANISPLMIEEQSFSSNDSPTMLTNELLVNYIDNGSLVEDSVEVAYFDGNDFSRGDNSEIKIKNKGINKVGSSGNVTLTVTENEQTGDKTLNANFNASAYATVSSVETLSGRVTTAEGKITTAEGDIDTLQSETAEIPGIKTRLTTAEGNITTNTNAIANLSAVARTGSYTDLSNKPTLSTVATTGQYNDLLGKPEIPDEFVDQSFEETQQGTPTLTNADLLGGTSKENLGINMDLLWTNPNPTSTFASQDVIVTSTSYNHFIVVCKSTSDEYYYRANVVFKDFANQLNTWGQNGFQSFVRTCTVGSGAINFGNAYRTTPAYSSSADVQNAGCIPYKIYGIK